MSGLDGAVGETGSGEVAIESLGIVCEGIAAARG